MVSSIHWKDFIDRNLLILKSATMELHGNILPTLPSVLRCNFQQVLDEETLSEEIKREIVVAQADKLSALHLTFDYF